VVLRNTGSAGNFSFAAPARFACPLQPRLSIADMDSDGKPDLVLLGDPGIDQFGILRNTSNPGSVSLAGPVNYNTGTMSTSIPVSDLDGDGKIDVAVCNNGDQQTGLFKNNSTGSLISLQPAFLYTAAVEPAAINLGDLDSDGKPDIIISNAELNQSVSIYRNTTGEPVRLNLCPPVAGTTFSSDQPGLSWQWQLNTGTGFVTINDNSNYSGTNTANLALVNIPDNWYGYQYRCLVNGTVYSSVFTLRFVNKWTGAESTAWENPLNWSCGVLPDANTDVEINEGTVILNSNKSCRTILVRPGAVFTVNSPFGLTVTY
jgi:hypothetical protein